MALLVPRTTLIVVVDVLTDGFDSDGEVSVDVTVHSHALTNGFDDENVLLPHPTAKRADAAPRARPRRQAGEVMRPA
jgi:hypothetical protein